MLSQRLHNGKRKIRALDFCCSQSENSASLCDIIRSGIATSEQFKVGLRCVSYDRLKYVQIKNWISISHCNHLRQASKPCDTL